MKPIKFDTKGYNNALVDTIEDLPVGPLALDIRRPIAVGKMYVDIDAVIYFDYMPGEPAENYSDGSGYPGSPAEMEAELGAVNKLTVYDKEGNEICSVGPNGEEDGDCSIITDDFLKELKIEADEYIEQNIEGYIEEVSNDADADDYYEESLSRSQYELIASSDASLFESILNKAGYKVIGRKDIDPLRTQVQSESVEALASLITESANDVPQIDTILAVAESFGYIVQFIKEG